MTEGDCNLRGPFGILSAFLETSFQLKIFFKTQNSERAGSALD